MTPSIEQPLPLVTYETRQALKAGLVAGAALLVEHIGLWHPSVRLTREQGYIVGTITLGAAYSWWGVSTREYRAVAAFWLIAAIGGAPVATAYWVRRRLEARDRVAFQAGAAYGGAMETLDATSPPDR